MHEFKKFICFWTEMMNNGCADKPEALGGDERLKTLARPLAVI